MLGVSEGCNTKKQSSLYAVESSTQVLAYNLGGGIPDDSIIPVSFLPKSHIL